MFVVGFCGDHGTAAADRFSIEIGIALIDAGCHESTRDPANCSTRSATCDGADRGCNEPASSDHGPHARDGQHAQAGQYTRRAARDTADSSTGARTWAGIRRRYRFLASINIIGNEANISSRDARGFEIANRLSGIFESIEYSRDWSCGHD
jgi:hypothetical protein